MVMRLQLVDGKYMVEVPIETVEALKLREGAPVKLTPVEVSGKEEHRYMTLEEGMAAFRSTLHENRDVYRELAK
jgi:hypothetical protein